MRSDQDKLYIKIIEFKETVYNSKYSIYVPRSYLRWLIMLNGDKVNTKVIVPHEIYDFVVNNLFI
jgi:hypothetical protein